MSSLEVIVAQSPAELEGPQARFDWLVESLSSGITQGADLLLLPELFLTGYNIGKNVKTWSESADGKYAKQIASLCRQHQIAIHYGYSESHGDKLFNSASCISQEGIKLASHRKLLLPPGFEGDHFSGGDSFETFVLNDFKIATLICYDAEFPENFRHIALQDVDLVLVPTALSSSWGVVAHNVIPTRAFVELQRAGSESQFLRAILSKSQVTAAQKRLPYLQDMRRISEILIKKEKL